MHFITIGQYFNKLQSVLLFVLIAPLLVFIALYFRVSGTPPDPRPEYFILLPAIAGLDWLIAMVIFNKKIKSVRNAQGLGSKLDKYFQLTIVRYSILSAGSLIMALGLYVTKSDIFTWIYVAGWVLPAILWPTGRKISDDLALKGDEREMVHYKKDMF